MTYYKIYNRKGVWVSVAYTQEQADIKTVLQKGFTSERFDVDIRVKPNRKETK